MVPYKTDLEEKVNEFDLSAMDMYMIGILNGGLLEHDDVPQVMNTTKLIYLVHQRYCFDGWRVVRYRIEKLENSGFIQRAAGGKRSEILWQLAPMSDLLKDKALLV